MNKMIYYILFIWLGFRNSKPEIMLHISLEIFSQCSLSFPYLECTLLIYLLCSVPQFGMLNTAP